MTEVVRELATYRLDRGWGVPQLAADMKAAGWPISERTLYTVLDSPKLRPRPVTLHFIRKYVQREKDAGRLPWRGEQGRAIA
jgi:hypothetical protein